jgi:ankyrin repeat protein
MAKELQNELNRTLLEVTDSNLDEAIKLEQIKDLLDRGASIHARDRDGNTPLILAAASFEPDIVRLLLERGADANAVNYKSGRTALVAAIGFNDRVMLEALLASGADINLREPPIGQSEYQALTWEQKKTIYLSLGEGEAESVSRLRGIMGLGFAPIHQAAFSGELMALELLFELGADIEARDYRGHTPLYIACEEHMNKAAGFLLDRGALIEAKNFEEMTPLMGAASWGNLQGAELLLPRGADVQARDRRDRDTLMHAILGRGAGSEATPGLVRVLIRAGCDVRAVSDEGCTALDYASRREMEEIVELLEEAGANSTDA